MPENVKCADCGFLALRRFETRDLVEMEDGVRKMGGVPTVVTTGDRQLFRYEPGILCFARAYDLENERKQSDARTPEEKFFNVLNRLRSCYKFTAWQQGFTPKEHYETIQEAERQMWQAERDEAQRRFQAEQAQLTREHNDRSIAIAKQSAWIAFASVCVAILGLLTNTALSVLKQPSSVIVQRPTTASTAPSLPKTDR